MLRIRLYDVGDMEEKLIGILNEKASNIVITTGFSSIRVEMFISGSIFDSAIESNFAAIYSSM